MAGFCVVAWPGVDEQLRAAIRDLLLKRSVAESTFELATHVFLLLPVAGDEADSPLPVDDDRIIPVVVGSSPSKIMPQRSQLVVPMEKLPGAADRLASLTRLTAAQLVAANGLRNAAMHWSASDKDESLLLPPTELPEATQTLLATMSAGVSDDTTRTYVATSRSAASRRVRRQAGVLGAAVVALLIATILAVQFSISSQRAAAQARDREAEAQSIRLASQAETLLEDGSDPDLPWLLANAALRERHTLEAEMAARMVTATIPPHLSAQLATRPRLVALTEDSGTVAVAYRDGSAEVFDAQLASIRTITSITQGNPTSALAVSEDGRCVAVSSGSLVGTDCGEARHQWTLDAPIVGLSWHQDLLTVITTNGIHTGLPGSGSPTRLHIQLDAEILDASFTPDGREVALATKVESVLIGLDEGGIILTGAGGNRIAVHPSGDEFLVRDSTGIAVLAEVTNESADSANSGNPTEVALVSVYPGAPYLASPRTNTLCAVDRLEHGLDYCFMAHQGTIIDADGTQGGMLASIGSDNRVRLWRNVEPRSHVDPDLAGANSLAGDFDPRQGNKVAWNPESGRLVALRYGTGVLGVFDDLGYRTGGFFGLQLGTPISLSSNGAAMARWIGGTLTCRSTLADDWPVLLEVETEPDLPLRPLYMAPANDCSVTVACYVADCYRVDASGIQQIQAPNPIGLGTDRNGVPEIHNADGSAESAYGHAALGAGEPALSATSSRDRVTWVTSSYQLRTAARGGEPLELLQLPRTWNVLRMEILADGDLVAVHSWDRILIAGTQSPNDLRYVGPGPEAAQGIHDVAVTSDGDVISVSSKLGLRREPLENVAGLQERLHSGQPRALTDDERQEFGVIG